jgi:hypothetical protein
MKMMSEYEEVNATDNCVTMITVMPGTTRSTLTSSGGQSSAGLVEAGGGSFGVLGQAHCMFSRFLNLQSFSQNILWVVFLYQVEFFFEIKN